MASRASFSRSGALRRTTLPGLVLLVLALTAPFSSAAPRVSAPGSRAWVASADVSQGWDEGRAIAASPDGSRIFVLGFSYGSAGIEMVTLAYDQATGAELWRATDTGPNGWAFPEGIAVAPDGSAVYVNGSGGGHTLVSAYDPADGSILWRTSASSHSWGGSPVRATAGGVFFAAMVRTHRGYALQAQALDPATGTTLWRSSTAGMNPQAAGISPDGTAFDVFGDSWGASRADGGTGQDMSVAVFDTGSGAVSWTRSYDWRRRTQSLSSSAVSPDGAALYLGGTESGAGHHAVLALALDAATGDVQWRRRIGGGSVPRDTGGFVAVTPDGGHVLVAGTRSADVLAICLDAQTGTTSWTSTYDGPYGGNNDVDEATAIAVAPDGSAAYVAGRFDGDVFAAGNLGTAAFAVADGSLLWADEIDGLGIEGDRGTAIAVSSDGSWVTTTGALGNGDPTLSDIGTVAHETT